MFKIARMGPLGHLTGKVLKQGPITWHRVKIWFLGYDHRYCTLCGIKHRFAD